MGINLGDIIIEDDDIFGDGVNIAARLEALAEPGGICLSAAAHEQVGDRLDLAVDDLGEQQVKNITRPVRVYRVSLSDKQGPTAETTAALFRAKYMVGEAVSRITRMALTLGGAHGIFKTSRLEQLFRDGALGPLQPPPSDFCLYNIGFYELNIDPADALPPMKPAQ
jgi:alkylation response protein AidB-like acyl-CoA dehydrogenase